MKLILEAGARGHGVPEAGLAQRQDFDPAAAGDAGGVARFIDDKDALAEEIARADARNEPVFDACPVLAHVHNTVADEEKSSPGSPSLMTTSPLRYSAFRSK